MRALLVVVGVYLVYVCVGCAIQRRVLFPTWIVPEYRVDAAAYPPALQRHAVPTPAGSTPYFYIPAPGDGPRPLVVFAHGNAEVIDFWPPLLQPYLDLGVSVLLVEYRGYADADGEPGQRAITDDFAAALDAVCQRGEVDERRLIYHGRSIGCGVACGLARRRPPAAIVMQSGFTSVRRMAWRYGYPGSLMRDPFDNAAVLREYDGPVLLLHGERDRIIPFDHSWRLHAMCPDSTLIAFEHAGHNDVPIESPEFWRAVERFLSEAGLIDG